MASPRSCTISIPLFSGQLPAGAFSTNPTSPDYAALSFYTVFQLFLSDSIENLQSKERATEALSEIYQAFAKWNGEPGNEDFKNDFNNACKPLKVIFSKENQNILDQFNKWITLLNNECDITRLTIKEAEELQKVLAEESVEKQVLQGPLTVTIDHEKALEVTSRVSALIKQQLTQFQATSCKLLKKDPQNFPLGTLEPEQKDGIRWETFQPSGKKISFPMLPLPTVTYDWLVKCIQASIAALADVERSALCFRSSRTGSFQNQEEGAILQRNSLKSQIETAKMAWEEAAKELPHKEKARSLSLLNKRVEAHRNVHALSYRIDLIELLFDDLIRYNTAIKESENRQEPVEAPPKRRRIRKGKGKAEHVEENLQPSVKDDPQLKEEEWIGGNIQKIFLEGRMEEVNSKFWYRLAQKMDQLPIETPRFQPTLKRLFLAVLHSLLEQTIASHSAASRESTDHNLLARYKKMLLELKLEKNAALELEAVLGDPVKKLYEGINWSRFTRERLDELERLSETLPVDVPNLLKLLSLESSPQIKNELILLRDQVVTAHDESKRIIAEAQKVPSTSHTMVEAANLSVLALENVKKREHLLALIEKVKKLQKTSPFLMQWSDDLNHLEDTLTLMESASSPEEYVLLFSHALLLLQGTVQSPLYFLLKMKNGVSSNSHDLLELYNSLHLPLSDKQKQLIERDINMLSHIHRYPFSIPGVVSTAHHLFLQAITWGLNPFEKGKKEDNSKKNRSFDHESGAPRLRVVSNPKHLRPQFFELVESTIETVAAPLYGVVDQAIREACKEAPKAAPIPHISSRNYGDSMARRANSRASSSRLSSASTPKKSGARSRFSAGQGASSSNWRG